MNDRVENVVGRIETVAFPDLGLSGLRAKIDTGAYGSSIHCASQELTDDGLLLVSFAIPNTKEDNNLILKAEFTDFSRKNVVSSNGISEERFVVETTLEMGGITFDINLSFTDRAVMRNEVLIGRKFLKRNRLIVNPRAKNVFSRKQRK